MLLRRFGLLRVDCMSPVHHRLWTFYCTLWGNFVVVHVKELAKYNFGKLGKLKFEEWTCYLAVVNHRTTLKLFCQLITGRNEVFAKVIFLHLSVIHSVHGGGVGYPSMPCRSVPRGSPIFRGGVSNFSGGGVSNFLGGGGWGDFFLISAFFGDTPPPRDHPECGQRSAGTHPTGMHSC